jgi:hypothetical protein
MILYLIQCVNPVIYLDNCVTVPLSKTPTFGLSI